MKQIRIHMAPKSLFSQCDYRVIETNLWTRSGRYISKLNEF